MHTVAGNRRCVVSLCNDRGRYRENMERLRQSLIDNFDGDFLGFDGEESIDSPKHEDNPYAFKIYAIEKAIEKGYKSVIWLDSSVFAIKKLDPIFDEIEKYGYIMQEAGHMVGTWCNDFTLDYFDITRDEAMKMPMYGNAGFLGLDLKNEIAVTFFTKWANSMLAGCFKGDWSNHRHDMTAGSIIANILGMEFKKGDEWLEYASPGTPPKNETIILQAQG